MANILPHDLLLSIKAAESSLVTHWARIWAGVLDSWRERTIVLAAIEFFEESQAGWDWSNLV